MDPDEFNTDDAFEYAEMDRERYEEPLSEEDQMYRDEIPARVRDMLS